MGLSSILTSLQNLVSKSFALSSFAPSLVFWFANALMLFVLNSSFRAFALSVLSKNSGLSALIVTVCVAGIAMFAYTLSALLPAIQTIMEGNWPQWATWLFVPAQMKQFELLEEKIAKNVMLRGRLGSVASNGQTQIEFWKTSLRTARQAGGAAAVNNFDIRKDSAKKVVDLAKRRRHSLPISANEINAAVTQLVFELRSNNADLPGPAGDYALESIRALLWDLIEYADQFAASEYRQLLTERQFTFGELPLAPTKMGNVAKTVQGYAARRYNFNFVLFWSRLQSSAQADKDFGPRLESTKTQLDFLVACTFLTFIWTGIWAIWLITSGGSPLLFLGVSLVGPIVAWMWYRVAIAQYRTFADVLRSSIDLFRFTLLQQLNLSLPDGVLQERELWQDLDALHGMYEIRDMRYSHQKSS
jgi:hypothetical protein